MNFYNRIHNIFSNKYLLVAIVFVFVSYFTFVSFTRHDNYYSLRLDLGNMDQTVWNVIHGNGFTLTDPVGFKQESRLAVHADFILILLAPLYLIWSNPKMLLIVQALAFGFGAFPLYWITEKKLKSRPLALLFVIAYLLYPPRERTMLYDFHAVALAGPLLLFAYWFMDEGKWPLFILFALLAGLCKEQIWLTVAFLGLYITVAKKKIALGVIVTAFSLIIFYILFWKIIPLVSPGGQHFAFVYLSDFGNAQDEILKNIVIHPGAVLATVLHPDRLYYLFQLFFPLGFLSLLSPFTLLFVSESFAINLLSNNPLMRQIDFQYNSVIAPFIFIAAVEGFGLLKTLFIKKRVRVSRYGVLWIVCCMLAASYTWGELPVGRNTRFAFFITPQQDVSYMDKVISGINFSYTVSATNNVGAHLSERKVLYNFPVGAQTADYVVVKLGDTYAWPSNEVQQAMVVKLTHDIHYTLIAHRGNFYTFRKKNLSK